MGRLAAGSLILHKRYVIIEKYSSFNGTTIGKTVMGREVYTVVPECVRIEPPAAEVLRRQHCQS